MVKRLTPDARLLLLTSAAAEALRRGDRRIGTDHLLLGLLHDRNSAPAKAVGVDLTAARAADDALDRAALAAVGVDAVLPVGPALPARRRGLPPLTSGARAVLKRTVDEARQTRGGRIDTRHFLLALLTRERPDPAAELLAALGVDRSAVRQRLSQPAL